MCYEHWKMRINMDYRTSFFDIDVRIGDKQNTNNLEGIQKLWLQNAVKSSDR